MLRAAVFAIVLASPGAAIAVEACHLESRSVVLDGVRVHPNGEAPFEIAIANASADALLAGTTARLRLIGEIELDAEIAVDKLGIAVRAGSHDLDRQLTIDDAAKDASVIGVDGAHAKIELHLAGSTIVSGATFACDRLTLVAMEQKDEHPRRLPDGAHTDAVSTHPSYTHHLEKKRFVLQRAPGAPGGLTVQSEATLAVAVLERRQGHAHVAVDLDGAGAVAEGWVNAAWVKASPPAASFGSLGSIGKGGGCGHGCPQDAGDYVGAALVRAGAQVFSAAKKQPWATARPTGTWTVLATPGSEWVAVGEMPNVRFTTPKGCKVAVDCGEALAYVRKADVQLGIVRKNGLTIERAWPIPESDTAFHITEVTAGSRWATLGFRVGDRIERGDWGNHLDAADWARLPLLALRHSIGTGGYALTVRRDGKPVTIALPDTCACQHQRIGSCREPCIDW